jgi:hypothetical protein
VTRGMEIQEWLVTNPVDRYIIIDDSTDFLKEQKKYHIKTDPDEGFSFSNYQKSLKLLGVNTLFFI